jgi:hypothetical protein
VFSQTAINKITKEICKKLDQRELFNGKSKETMEMKFGLVIFKESLKYKDQLYKENNIDVNGIFKKEKGNTGDLGELIGGEIITECPDTFLDFIGSLGSLSDSGDEKDELFLSGIVTDVKANQFYILSIEDERKRTTELLHLNKIGDISNPNVLKGKKSNFNLCPILFC